MKWVISLELNKIKQLNTLHYYINMCFQQKHLRGLRIYLQIIRKIQSKIAIICLWRDNPFANVQQNAHLRTEPGEYARYCLILGICLMITFSTIIPYSPRSPFHILGMLQLKFSVLTNQGKHSLLVYLLAPSGALIAIPTYYWSPPTPLFQITPVLNTGLSLSEPLQLYKGYNAI